MALAMRIIYQEMVAGLVDEIQDGEPAPSLGKLVAAVAPLLVSLLGAAILYSLATGVGIFQLVIPALFMATFWAVIAPAIVEKRGLPPLPPAGTCFARRVFGVILAVAVVVLGAEVGGLRRGGGSPYALFSGVASAFRQSSRW
jgi:hypothetical protein